MLNERDMALQTLKLEVRENSIVTEDSEVNHVVLGMASESMPQTAQNDSDWSLTNRSRKGIATSRSRPAPGSFRSNFAENEVFGWEADPTYGSFGRHLSRFRSNQDKILHNESFSEFL